MNATTTTLLSDDLCFLERQAISFLLLVHLSTHLLRRMASCAASLGPRLSVSRKAGAIGGVQASFAGLRSKDKVDFVSVRDRRSFGSRISVVKSAARTTCDANTALTISLSTGALLFLGRFVFLPFQRDNVSIFISFDFFRFARMAGAASVDRCPLDTAHGALLSCILKFMRV